jgi:signal peptidase II
MSPDTIRHRVITIAILVFATDQLTKLAGTLNLGGAFVPVHNPNYSLGIIGAPTVALIAVSAVTLMAAGRHGVRLARAGRVPAWVPGIILGGAASNLVDRLVFGAVRDFIPTPIVIFNVADVAVLGGLAVFAWSAARNPIVVTSHSCREAGSVCR